jgi:hypothetical protein
VRPDFRLRGEAGLARTSARHVKPLGRVDDRWTETALEVMAEHTDQSRPSRTMVIDRANARVVARFGPGVVQLPSRATAFRVLAELERRHPTFRLSTKRNRDIADRPAQVYGKLRPARPGEYMLMDTTRLDVFGFDPVTLRWVQAELTVAMDWYTRSITGIRLTPVSTKAVDAAATLYQAYRPKPAGKDWPAHAVWPEHGVPRSVLIDRSRDDCCRSREDLRLGASNQRVQPAGDIDPARAAADRAGQRPGGKVLPNLARGPPPGPARVQGPGCALSRPRPGVRGILLPRRTRSDHPRVGGGGIPPPFA